MVAKRKLIINKVPLGYKQIYKPINFAPMPQLYLDLIENKNKVKLDLRDKLYEPHWDNEEIQNVQISNEEMFDTGQEFKNSLVEFDADGQELSGLTFATKTTSLSSQIKKEGFSKPYSELDESSPHNSLSKFVSEPPPLRNKPTLAVHKGPMKIINTSKPPRKFTMVNEAEPEVEEDYDDHQTNIDDDIQEDLALPDEPQDELSQFLSADLDTAPTIPSQSVYSPQPIQRPSQPLPPRTGNVNFQAREQAPRRPMGLDDINLNQSKQSRVLNIPQTASSKAEDDKGYRRSELLFQFKKLKKFYKEAVIPEFTEYTDLDIMEKEYALICKQLQIDSNVENYKRYMTMGFGVVEFLVKKFLKFEEISGFAADQMIKMNQYEKILYEIGEKHQPKPGKGLPAEVKLLGIILFNAAVFVGMKMLMKGPGNALFSSTVASPSSSSASTSRPVPGHKPMKGPDIDFEDL